MANVVAEQDVAFTDLKVVAANREGCLGKDAGRRCLLSSERIQCSLCTSCQSLLGLNVFYNQLGITVERVITGNG